MSEATLRIRAEGGPEVAALLAQVERLAEASRQRVARSTRSHRQREMQESAQAAQQEVANYRQSGEAIRRQDQLVSRAKLRELARRGEDQKKFAALYAEMEKRATSVLEAEIGKRGALTDREKKQVETLALAMVAAHERAERQKTATTAQEEQRRSSERARFRARVVGHVVQTGAAAAGAAGSFAQNAHGQIQGARERRAGTEHDLNSALYQAGVEGPEAAAMRAEVLRFAQSRGMDSGNLAGAIGAAQTQFSVLSGANPAARQAALRQQLSLAEFAQSTYQDPGEVLRVAGMLNQQGVRGGDQRQMLLALTGMAQAGSIELGTLTSEALGPLMQNVARVTNGNMSPEQRSRAVRNAVSETMAVGEIGAAAGLSPRDTLNALAKTRASVVNPRMAENLYERLRSEGRGGLANELTVSENGHRRLANADPIALMSRLVSAYGGDANAVTNMLASGGPGSPMILDSQQRRLIGAMASQTASGGTIAGRVAEMQAAGGRFGEGDVARGRAMVAGEQATALARNEEARLSALTTNTGQMGTLSNQVQELNARFPLLTAALGPIAVAAGAALGTTGTVAAAGGLGMQSQSNAAVSGRTAFGEQVGGLSRLGRGAASLAFLGPLGGVISAAITARDAHAAASSPEGLNGLLRALPGAFAQELRAQPLTATVSPIDATHAQTVASTRPAPAP